MTSDGCFHCYFCVFCYNGAESSPAHWLLCVFCSYLCLFFLPSLEAFFFLLSWIRRNSWHKDINLASISHLLSSLWHTGFFNFYRLKWLRLNVCISFMAPFIRHVYTYVCACACIWVLCVCLWTDVLFESWEMTHGWVSILFSAQ